MSTYRCPTCKSASKKSRNLVVFIDGTSNKPGDKNTNVVKLFQNVIDESMEDSELTQRKYYLKGIGAYDLDQLDWLGRKRKEIYSGFEMAFAWNVERNIKDAYNWLAGCYEAGNQIYLFGFSRGAYQVRALASMIHEVGLAKEERQTDTAYDHYLAIDPYKPETRRNATQFKKDFCWQGVRVHFVGVWDTVSSLGLIKRDVHVTASASVTNACHFRHALALDERRVKFMPEYFLEMNAHRGTAGNPRSAIGDVKEVWFAGTHSDVGGTERRPGNIETTYSEDDIVPYTHQPGNIPLLWMQREAADKDLAFKPEEFTWDSEDVDFGTRNSMTFSWGIFEIFPVRQQVSFSGTGKHKWRLHMFHPRSIIPGQQIHTSILSGYIYTPKATLSHGICIPPMKRNISEGLWITELPDEAATTYFLSTLLNDQETTLQCLEKVLVLLGSRLENGDIQPIAQSQWSEEDILRRSDFAKFALTVIRDVTSDFTISEELMTSARASLSTILSSPDHPDFHRVLYILRFLIRHRTLQQHFVDHDRVIEAIVFALGWTAKSTAGDLFLQVTDCLCCLMSDNNLQGKVVEQLSAVSDGTETTQSRISLALSVKSPMQLEASLKMITSLAQFQPASCEGLKPKIIEMARKRNGLVGSAAVEALAALNEPLMHDIPVFNILGYLGNILPQLDAEGGGAPSSGNTNDLPLPRILLVNGSGPLNEDVMSKLVLTVQSRNARERTAATFTLMKLCGSSIVRKFCSEHKVLDIFMQQLEQKKTSLLAAYALRTCLEYRMWRPSDFSRAAQLIVAMLDNWDTFDDAIGRVEGCEIFRGLMISADLRQHVNDTNIVDTLIRKLELGERHQVRMSLSCLDILGEENPLGLAQIVADSVSQLRDNDKNMQKKGVKVLAALARTTTGERAIMPHVTEIVRMLLPPSDSSKLFGPTAALYDLSKNETLRNEIRATPEFQEVKNRMRAGTLRTRKT